MSSPLERRKSRTRVRARAKSAPDGFRAGARRRGTRERDRDQETPEEALQQLDVAVPATAQDEASPQQSPTPAGMDAGSVMNGRAEGSLEQETREASEAPRSPKEDAQKLTLVEVFMRNPSLRRRVISRLVKKLG